MTTLTLVTASTEEPITRAEIKQWLRLDEHEIAEDPVLDGLVTRARRRFEEITGRSCLHQTYDYTVDAELDAAHPVVLPVAPLVRVTSITGYRSSELTDTGGVAMSTSGYYVDTASVYGRVLPASGFTYPTATRQIHATAIRFVAGYSSTPAGVPASIKGALSEIVAALYEHRGDDAEQGNVLARVGVALTEHDLPTWG